MQDLRNIASRIRSLLALKDLPCFYVDAVRLTLQDIGENGLARQLQDKQKHPEIIKVGMHNVRAVT